MWDNQAGGQEWLTMEDVIVLQEPKQEYKESINSNGYEYYKNIKTNIKYYLAKI